MEIDLRAQMAARTEIAGARNSFEAQVKEHADAVGKLQACIFNQIEVGFCIGFLAYILYYTFKTMRFFDSKII